MLLSVARRLFQGLVFVRRDQGRSALVVIAPVVDG